MGEAQPTLFPLDFNRSLVIEDRPERLTGDAGVPALGQIDPRLRLTDWPATLAGKGNRRVLRQSLLESAKRHLHARRKQAARRGVHPRRLRAGTLDSDSYVVVVHGHQPGATYNGHYQTVCYHRLAAQFAPTGDWLDMTLREGHVHTAHQATAFRFNLLERVEAELCQVSDVRADAGFPEEESFAGLETCRKRYVFRLKNNAVLDRRIEPYRPRPPGGRRPRRGCGCASSRIRPRAGRGRGGWWVWCVTCRASCSWSRSSWSRAGRSRRRTGRRCWDTIASGARSRVTWASSRTPSIRRSRRARGSRPNIAAAPPRKRYASREVFACNEALLVLHALAFNLANVGREGLEHTTCSGWTIRSFRAHLLKTPARVLRHARRAVVVLNDIAAYYWHGLARFLATLTPQPILARAP
jgi:hypothetical protein